MKRSILIEELIKDELQITHSGCRSSFSSIISQELTSKRETCKKETAKLKVQLERAKLLNEQHIDVTNLDFYRHNPAATFQSMPSSASLIYEEITEETNDTITLQRSYVRDLREEAIRYRQDREVLRHQLQTSEAHRQRLLEQQVENYQRQVGPSRILPQTAPPPDRSTPYQHLREEHLRRQRRLSDIDIVTGQAINNQIQPQTVEDTIDETTSKV